jgi:hypothetical protein
MPNPYLRDWRLADVIAAITLMGRYPYPSLKWQDWADRLGATRSADTWRTVFYQHPEFFRLSEEEAGWASLRLRYGFDRTYSLSERREVSPAELSALAADAEEYKDLTRRPLSPGEIESLTNTASTPGSSPRPGSGVG